MLGALAAPEQERLVGAMQRRRVGSSDGSEDDRDLAAPAPPRRHGLGGAGPRRALCARSTAGTSASRRWSAEIVADFVERLDPARERCWIAEMDGERVGSVFVVQGIEDRGEAAPAARRAARRAATASASAWCDECIAFARGRATASSCYGRSRTSPRRARSTQDGLHAGQRARSTRASASSSPASTGSSSALAVAVADHPVAAFLLGLVERAVGARGERVERAAVLRVAGDADAHRGGRCAGRRSASGRAPIASRMRSATSSAPLGGVSGSSTMNSSPP